MRLRKYGASAVMTKQDENPSDRVGYKMPPKKGQFTKGKSGNAGGRPKKRTLDLDDRVIAKLEAHVPHSDQTVLDIILNGAIKAGANGDIKAVRLLLDMYVPAKRRRHSVATDDEGDRKVVERILGADHRFFADLHNTDHEQPAASPAQRKAEPGPDE